MDSRNDMVDTKGPRSLPLALSIDSITSTPGPLLRKQRVWEYHTTLYLVPSRLAAPSPYPKIVGNLTLDRVNAT